MALQFTVWEAVLFWVNLRAAPPLYLEPLMMLAPTGFVAKLSPSTGVATSAALTMMPEKMNAKSADVPIAAVSSKAIRLIPDLPPLML
jgi:hypothetical protein